MPKIYLSAGEASGDAHAAKLASALVSRAPNLEVFGMGGALMREAGVDITRHIDDLAVMGFVEVVTKYPALRRAFNEGVEVCSERRPDVAVLVDYPAFHMRLAAKLRALGIPTVLYIAPQVWAWRPKRKRMVAEVATKLLVIFEFEVEVFRPLGIDVEFVGHPLLDEIDPDAPRGKAREALGIDADVPLMAIMPGSRSQIRRSLLPVWLEVADAIRQEHPDIAVALGTTDGRIGEWAAEFDIPCPAARAHDLLRDATAGLLNSGTVSLEAAILGCPGVIGYSMGWINYQIARQFVKLPYVGLPNIVLGGLEGDLAEPAMPELIQKDLKASVAAVKMLRLLTDAGVREAARARLAKVREKLGSPGASDRAAEAVLKML